MTFTRRALLAALPSALLRASSEWDQLPFFDVPYGRSTKRVYQAGSGRPVLFLHEINGLSPACLAFAQRLAARGFAIYLPLLFGNPGDDKWWRPILKTPCWTSEFNCASREHIGAIVPWIAALAGQIDQRHQGRGMAVIGNCLTGSVPLALMADQAVRPHLRCAVLSQPALPLGLLLSPILKGARNALAVTPDQLSAAAASNIPALALRFDDDPVVPIDRLQSLTRAFKGRPFEFCSVPHDVHCAQPVGGKMPTFHHAVLTEGYCGDPRSHGYKAFEKVTGFLQANL